MKAAALFDLVAARRALRGASLRWPLVSVQARAIRK